MILCVWCIGIHFPKHLNCPWFYQPDTPNTKIIISITLLMRLIIFQTASYLWFPPPTSGNDSQIQLTQLPYRQLQKYRLGGRSSPHRLLYWLPKLHNCASFYNYSEFHPFSFVLLFMDFIRLTVFYVDRILVDELIWLKQPLQLQLPHHHRLRLGSHRSCSSCNWMSSLHCNVTDIQFMLPDTLL